MEKRQKHNEMNFVGGAKNINGMAMKKKKINGLS